MNYERERRDLLAVADAYAAVTFMEIEQDWLGRGRTTMMMLTGFGSYGTCVLCRQYYCFHGAEGPMVCDECSQCPSNPCWDCPWRVLTGTDCSEGENEASYDAIKNAKTPRETLDAIRAREEHIRQVVNQA